MFWITAKDSACVIVSQYRNALQSNNIVAVTHAYYYQFQLPAGSSTRNDSKIYTLYVLRNNLNVYS